jgi:hypothetical protein
MNAKVDMRDEFSNSDLLQERECQCYAAFRSRPETITHPLIDDGEEKLLAGMGAHR